METEIVAKWCTYGAFHRDYPLHVGLLEEQRGNTGKIRYAEKQMYPLEYWDMDYVMVHDSLEDAIRFLIKNNPDESVNTVRDYLPFETEKGKIDWNNINN